MPSTSLPVVDSLHHVYSASALLPQGVRWNSLLKSFQEEYDSDPAQRISRAPGESCTALIHAQP